MPETLGAPAVRYPLVRSAWLGRLLVGMAALDGALLAAWALSDAAPALLPLCAALTVWALACLCVGHFWVRSPCGVLVWSGQCWSMESMSGVQPVAVQVHLDLQSFLWLRLCRQGLRPQWVWLERSTAAGHWLDLRRAVYSRPRPGVPGAPHSA